jgi:hypothetical protein
VILDPRTLQMIADFRDDVVEMLEGDRDALQKLRGGNPGYHFDGMTVQESEQVWQRQIAREAEEVAVCERLIRRIGAEVTA